MSEVVCFDSSVNSARWQEPSFVDECRYFRELEEGWRRSQSKFTDKEWLEIFPEAKKAIPKKLAEGEKERERIVKVIRAKLKLIKSAVSDEFSLWFWREWVKVDGGHELLEIDRQLARLRRLQSVAKGRVVKGWLTEDQIQRALAVPIEDIASQHTKLHRSGKNLVGLCPLHEEKHPSFYIYRHTNSFFCFGCKKAGNSINLVRLLRECSFKEAVRYLIGEWE